MGIIGVTVIAETSAAAAAAFENVRHALDDGAAAATRVVTET